MTKRTYIGFDSTEPNGKNFDEDLIVQDLLNHFFTRQGERVMNPEFGSIVWDLLFEHKSEFIKNEILRDSRRILESDPRVEIQNLEIIEIEYGYIADILLSFVDFGTIRPLQITFNQQLNQETRT